MSHLFRTAGDADVQQRLYFIGALLGQDVKADYTAFAISH